MRYFLTIYVLFIVPVVLMASDIVCSPYEIVQGIYNYNDQTCISKKDSKMKIFVEKFGNKSTSTRWNGTTIEEMTSWLVSARVYFPKVSLPKFDDSFTVLIDEDINGTTLGFVQKYRKLLFGFYALEDRKILHLRDIIPAKLPKHKELMQGTSVHEYFHQAQARNPLVNNNLIIDFPNIKNNWFTEGTARWFEDEVYDGLNTYIIMERYGRNILSVGINAEPVVYKTGKNKGKLINTHTRAYNRFSYIKLISSKCTDFKSNFNKMLNIPNGTSDPSGIKNFQNILPTLSCSFDGGLQTELNNDTLASSFVYYNWATLGQKGKMGDISKLEKGESGFNFTQLDKTSKFDVSTLLDFNPHLHVLNIDIDTGVYDARIPAYGAKSFKVLASTLPKKDPLNSIDELKFSLIIVNHTNRKNFYAVATKGGYVPTDDNSFVLKSDKSYPYIKSHIFEDDERGDDLFVTLVNTSDSPISLYSMRFEREILTTAECEKEALRLSEAATDKAVGDIYAEENGCKNPYTETCKTKTQKLLRTKGYAASYAYAKSNGCNDGGNNNDGGDNDGGGNGGPSGPGGDGGPSDPGGPGGDGGSNGGGDGGPSGPSDPGGPGGEDNKTCKDGKYPDGSECPCVDGKYPDGTECEDNETKECVDSNMPTPSGLFRAMLDWDNEEVSINMANKLMPNKAQGCGFVALGSGDLTLDAVYPGVYPIGISVSGTDKLDENITDIVSLLIHANGAEGGYDYVVNHNYEYQSLNNGGHLADIVISRDDPREDPTQEVVPYLPPSGGSGYSGGSAGSGNSRPWLYFGNGSDISGGSSTAVPVSYTTPSLCYNTYSCGCMPCDYGALIYLNQTRLGPISGANITLYKATGEDDVNRDILFSGQTSISSKIDQAGIIHLPVPNPKATILTTAEQNLMDAIKNYEGDFILEMSGGLDIDKDDDFNVDSTFTQVNGKLRLILSKQKLLQNDYKVNILTEISYQLSKDLLGENYDKVRLQTRLDDIAKRVLLEKLYPDALQPLGRDDLFYWVPMAHKNWLVKPYDSTLAPIVNKVYAGESIYEEAYNYVYNPLPQVLATVPVLKSHWFKVDENATGGTLVGSVKLTSEGNSTVTGYTLSGTGSALFRIQSDGKVYLENNATLDYESIALYQMQIIARNKAGKSKPVTLYITLNNILDVPEDRSFSGGVIAEDAVEGDVVGVMTFNEGATPLERITLAGTDASSFTIDLNGTLRVSGTASFDYETKNGANITLQAFNSLGGSRVVPVRIAISDAVDVPIVQQLDVHLEENATLSHLVGQVNILTNDPLTKVKLQGSGADTFSIDNNGTVRVAKTLDYETRANYVLQIEASNIQGTGRLGTLIIRIDNVADVPELNRTVMHVLEHSGVDTTVGFVTVGNVGSTAILIYTLSGTGATHFTIDNSGRIAIRNSTLSHSTQAFFNLYVTANNAEGESLRARVVIYIDTLRPILGILDSWVYEDAGEGMVVGSVPVASSSSNITSMQLVGIGHENFNIDATGKVRVASNANLDYESVERYSLRVTATNTAGISDTTPLYIRVIDRADTLKIKGFSTTVYEDTQAGSTLGFVSVVSYGGKTIDHYALTGTGATHFNISTTGIVTLSTSGVLNRSTIAKYHLALVAVDTHGVQSNEVFVDISVADSKGYVKIY